MFLQNSMKSFVYWSDHPFTIGRCVSWVVSNQFAQTLNENEVGSQLRLWYLVFDSSSGDSVWGSLKYKQYWNQTQSVPKQLSPFGLLNTIYYIPLPVNQSAVIQLMVIVFSPHLHMRSLTPSPYMCQNRNHHLLRQVSSPSRPYISEFTLWIFFCKS